MSICTLSLSEKLSNRHNKIWCSIEATLQLKLTKTYDTKATIAEKDYIRYTVCQQLELKRRIP